MLVPREKVLKNREAGNLKHSYRSKLDKSCFAHDTAYSDSKDLAKRTSHIRFWKILNMMDIEGH